MAITHVNLNGVTYAIGGSVTEAGSDTSDSVVSFISYDEENPTSSDESVALLETEDTHRSLWEKMSAGMKNIRWLLKQIGTTDISSIGDGTITGAISAIQSSGGSVTLQWEDI